MWSASSTMEKFCSQHDGLVVVNVLKSGVWDKILEVRIVIFSGTQGSFYTENQLTWFLWLTRVYNLMASWSAYPFLYGWWCLPKIASSTGGSESPPNTSFIEPSRVYTPNRILIGSAVLVVMSIIHSDVAKSVAVGQIFALCACDAA